MFISIDFVFFCFWLLGIHCIQNSFFQDRFLADQLSLTHELPLSSEPIYFNYLDGNSLIQKSHIQLGEIHPSQSLICFIPICLYPSILIVVYAIKSFWLVLLTMLVFTLFLIYPILGTFGGNARFHCFYETSPRFRPILKALGRSDLKNIDDFIRKDIHITIGLEENSVFQRNQFLDRIICIDSKNLFKIKNYARR